MNVKAAMRDLPDIFTAVAELRGDYERAVREARLAEGPITILAAADSMPAAMAAELALDLFLGWPARTREPAEFLQYSIASVQPRSALIAISGGGANEDVIEAAAASARKGAKVLAVTWNRESALGASGHAILPLPPPRSEFPQAVQCLAVHAALLEIALAAARIFNPRNSRLAEIDLDVLPGLAGAMEFQHADSIRAAASQIGDSRRIAVVGGGFYYSSALAAAGVARALGLNAFHAAGPGSADLELADGALVISGSRCRAKKRIHAAAARSGAGGAPVVALTDANDHPLIAAAKLSLLAPELPEVAGSLLTLVLLLRLMAECSPRNP